MNSNSSIRRFWLITVGFVILYLATGEADAQLKGHYIAGSTGLDAGTQSPPGIYFANVDWIYPTDTVKNDNGDSILTNVSLVSFFEAPGISWVANTKVFGGNLGGTVLIPFIRNRIQSNTLESTTSLRFTDIYIQPLQLGWHHKKVDVVAGYGLFLPTGEFDPDDPQSSPSGLGMYSHELQLGATAYLDEKKTWDAALLFTYEINQTKRDTDLKPGNIITIEGGVGKTFYKKVNSPLPLITKVGLVGYTQFKVTQDSSAVNAPIMPGKDRVFALGPEFNMFVPQALMNFSVRYLPEFGARVRTQGQTIMITIGVVLKSLAKPKGP